MFPKPWSHKVNICHFTITELRWIFDLSIPKISTQTNLCMGVSLNFRQILTVFSHKTWLLSYHGILKVLLSDLVSQRGCYFQAPITLGQVLLWMIKKNVYKTMPDAVQVVLDFTAFLTCDQALFFARKSAEGRRKGKQSLSLPWGPFSAVWGSPVFISFSQRNAGVQNGWKSSRVPPLSLRKQRAPDCRL